MHTHTLTNSVDFPSLHYLKASDTLLHSTIDLHLDGPPHNPQGSHDLMFTEAYDKQVQVIPSCLLLFISSSADVNSKGAASVSFIN